ncbi:hypothetical protein PIB30_012150 [Stylosanthes scabra]|uniref:Uncharacterized protein n=1 Tax=Stylosanthes scabra TaxID=79078 RepID=A0ABU6S6G9_9FABA|nr:hypothetical protein [Stylosanthes scabra]
MVVFMEMGDGYGYPSIKRGRETGIRLINRAEVVISAPLAPFSPPSSSVFQLKHDDLVVLSVTADPSDKHPIAALWCSSVVVLEQRQPSPHTHPHTLSLSSVTGVALLHCRQVSPPHLGVALHVAYHSFPSRPDLCPSHPQTLSLSPITGVALYHH